MSEQEPARRISRRNLILGGGAVVVAAAAGVAWANWRDIVRFVAGRTDEQNRDLRWFNPAQHDMDGAEWQEYPKDQNAFGPFHRTWKMLGILTVDGMAYDTRTDNLRAQGLDPRQAFLFDNGRGGRAGVAYEGEGPDFFGLDKDGSRYLVGARIGHGLRAVLGHHLPSQDLFVAFPTQSLPAEPLSQLPQEHPN